MARPEAQAAEQVAVCLCTFRRPTQLRRALDGLALMARPPSTVFVVVDNDGRDPDIERQVQSFRVSSCARVEYVVESSPGISAARNAAIGAARALGANLVAMLDDDEWPSPDWLMRLLEMRRNAGAAVVGGPVRPVFPPHARNLERYRSLWSVREGRLGGRVYVSCTCNCLMDLDAVSILDGPPFAEEFGFTGGEDAVFFRRLFFAGVRMAWCESALVYEEIGEDRATIQWIRRRWYRQGNVGVRCERAAPGPGQMQPLLKTVLLCIRLPVYPFVNRRAPGSLLLWLLESDRIRGRIAGHFGMRFEEYGRA